MSLAIQVVGAADSGAPTMIFDEVDAGIGGGVADIVGQKLKQLGARRQVLCVTHLAQVAVHGAQHLGIRKEVKDAQTFTRVLPLSKDARTLEVARMLGGAITDTSRAHAQAMLAQAGWQELTPLARIHNLTVTAGDPVIMLEEPLFATDRAFQRSGMKIEDIDLYEVNEAFAPVPLAWLKHVGADRSKINVHGGAIALGHPLGASGTKLMATLLNALEARKGKYGLQTMCEGGGQANVTIIERV